MKILILMICLAGCKSYNDPSVKEANKTTLAGPGQEVGILPDGRQVVRYELSMGDSTNPHWVYIVNDSSTTTINHKVGKTPKVEVIIDGEKYNLSPDAEMELQ
jgi:hypothetical protein